MFKSFPIYFHGSNFLNIYLFEQFPPKFRQIQRFFFSASLQ